MTDRVKALLAVVAALLLAYVFGLALETDRGTFQLAYVGMEFPNFTEIFFNHYFLLFSLPALALLAYALSRTAIPEAVDRLGRRFLEWRFHLPALAVAAFLVILALRGLVLLGAPMTQDESTYEFIADTLEQGRVVNPLPEDSEFFVNEFVILNERGWFGKYPIGHPLLLAVAGWLKIRAVAVPLISALLLVATYALGRRIFGRGVALTAAVLLALSPQFLLTGGTLLSQPASALFATLGLLGLVVLEKRAQEKGPALIPALLAGACFGYAFLVRPFPGILFVPVVAVYLLARVRGASWPRTLLLWSAVAVPVALGGLGFMAVNEAQSGHPLRSGYHEAHSHQGTVSMATFGQGEGRIVSSVTSALMRLNLWQAGFPLIGLLALLARRRAATWFLWGMFAALLAYRFMSPKAGVMCTGPVYVYEALPWLAILVADGLRRLLESPALAWLESRRQVVISTVLAGFAVALLFFWPVQLKSLHFGALDHLASYRVVEAQGIDNAVVFYESRLQGTWARYLRNPRPDLSDDVLYLRQRTFTYAELDAFARRRFPDRSRWGLLYERGRNPKVFPLDLLVEQERRRAAAPATRKE